MSSILHVAVMSPNRYFCLGLNSLHEQKAMPAIQLHFCHDLKSLKALMESATLSGVPETSPCLFFAHSGAIFLICRIMRAIMFPQLKMKYGNILN